MALRAGYYGLKRRIRGKLYNLLEAVPAGIGPDNPIASKKDVLTAADLLDDTVGWIGENWLSNDTTSFVGSNVTMTVNTDKSVTVSTTAEGASAQVTRVLHDVVNNGVILDTSFIGKRFKLVGCPEGGSERTYFLQYFRYDGENSALDFGAGSNPFTVGEVTTGYSNIAIIIKQGTIITEPITFYPMLVDPDIYELLPAYRQYHASVEDILDVLTTSASDQKTAINAILAAAADAADFAAFKTAMGAITPVSRSLSIQAPETREVSEPDPEPEAKETKKSTKKSTAKAD